MKKALIVLGVVGTAALAWWLGGLGTPVAPDPESRSEESAVYVGREACVDCHAQQDSVWTGSHHDLAMQPASGATVLGDFDAASFVHGDTESVFVRDSAGFAIEVREADGTSSRLRVPFTFGVHPLQQYLVELPGGRLQSFPVAWDSRAADQGGQRWFHLYPDEEAPPGDPFHWAGMANNWNYMCAECHSTDLEKGYDGATDTYATTWEEVNVSCEACHGPGSEHVAWAEAAAADSAAGRLGAREAGAERPGLTVELGDPGDGQWVMDPVTGIAARTAPPGGMQIETCARCHSRRSTLAFGTDPGGLLMESHLPRTLGEGLYHADGQILDEVYVYGSFLQSSMYRAGVLCSDCHEPHGLGLKAPGNGVCASCHDPTRFDTPEHHFHEADTDGAQCVSCHMPDRTYMIVDPRRDHSLRVPRPDLSDEVGAPDACTACHADRSSSWAADAVAGWYGADRRAERHYGQILAAGRRGAPGSDVELAALVADTAWPAIVRATAVEMLAARPGPMLAAVLANAVRDADPLVRSTAAQAAEVVPVQNRLQVVGPLLSDTVLAVRSEAARLLAGVPANLIPPAQARLLDRALAEYVASLQAMWDHPSSRVGLARLHADQGRVEEAEASLRSAIDIGPWFVPSWVNLADLYRAQGRDAEGELLLRRGLDQIPDAPELHHALALLLVRTGRSAEAVSSLATAAELAPDNGRFAYAYGVGLNSLGSTEQALEVLAEASSRQPYDPEILFALATISRDAGRLDEALGYARRLAELRPQDPSLAALISQLEAGR